MRAAQCLKLQLLRARRLGEPKRTSSLTTAINGSLLPFVFGIPSRRLYSTAFESYTLDQSESEKSLTDLAIQQRAVEPQRSIQLHRLARFKPMGDNSPEVLLNNAREVIYDITVRLARRLEAMRNLPYLVVLNPYISQIYNIYYNSFRVLNSLKPPSTLEENEQFVNLLEKLVQTHLNTIPTLAKGFSESRDRFLDAQVVNEILEAHLIARIGTRLLAEHHIYLTHPIGPNFTGTLQNDLNPKTIIEVCAQLVGEICNLRYGVTPTVAFEQGQDVKLAYVPVHLEYICTELLKNAFRAVCENGSADIPVLVTVIPTGQGVIIRFRDRGGGIATGVEKDIFKFSYSTFGAEERDTGVSIESEISAGSSIAGLGYGLPLSRAYAEFFGGKLQVQSYFGWGTDVYLTLKSPLISGYHREVS